MKDSKSVAIFKTRILELYINIYFMLFIYLFMYFLFYYIYIYIFFTRTLIDNSILCWRDNPG